MMLLQDDLLNVLNNFLRTPLLCPLKVNIRRVQGLMENSFKTAGGETHVATQGQQYGHTQGTPAETLET